jgi:hypothetical protein
MEGFRIIRVSVPGEILKIPLGREDEVQALRNQNLSLGLPKLKMLAEMSKKRQEKRSGALFQKDR